MQVVVNNPPDFFNHTQRKVFSEMMEQFENSHYTMKHNATMFWLTAFEAKLADDSKEFNMSMPTK